MARWAVIGSIVLFASMLVDLVWGNTLLPRSVDFGAVICIVIGWSISISTLSRQLILPVRVTAASWLLLATFVGQAVMRSFSGYYFFHSDWSRWIALEIADLLFVASAIALAILLLRKLTASTSVTPFTVESEAPDHVLHVSSAPDYSLKASAANRRGVN